MAAGVSAVIRGDVSDRDGYLLRADATCKTPLTADEQKVTLDEIAMALRAMRGQCSELAQPGGAPITRERIAGMVELAWTLSPRLVVGCATCPDIGSRFVALWCRAGDDVDLTAQKDMLRAAICYEMVLLRRSRLSRSAALAARVATQTLNRLAIPLFVTGPDREIVRMNTAARAWLRQDGRLSLSNRRLIGASSVLNAKLRAAIQLATAGPDFAIVPLGDAASSGPAVTLSCAQMIEPKDHVLIAVQERRCDLNLAQQTLTALGLTQAERRLASFLGTGMDLQGAAAASGVTFSTARSYLKRIFGKLGIARQSDLVGLVAALTPVFLTDDSARLDEAGAMQDAAEESQSDHDLDSPEADDHVVPRIGHGRCESRLVLAQDQVGEPGSDSAR